MKKSLWIALAVVVVIAASVVTGWFLRDGRAKARERAAAERSYRDSVAFAEKVRLGDIRHAATRDSIARERAALAAIIAAAEHAGHAMDSTVTTYEGQLATFHVKLRMAQTAMDSFPLLKGALQVAIWRGDTLKASRDSARSTVVGLRRDSGLVALDRVNDSTRWDDHLVAEKSISARLREDVLAATDTIRSLRKSRKLFGFLPRPDLEIGYGLHAEQPRKACQATIGRLPPGTVTDLGAVCAGESSWKVAKGLHVTLGFRVPIG